MATDPRRYARHRTLPGLGEAGQARLSTARVAVLGAGGLGSAALSYLAAAGIGHLTVIDHDHVEASNLARQILHEQSDVGRRKAESARDRIEELNPEVAVAVRAVRLDASNAASLLAGHDLVLDGGDNFPSRIALARACRALRVPLVSAAALGWEGQVTSFTPWMDGEPCYRCLVPELPADADSCATNGVLGPLCGVMGSMQAVEAVRILLGRPSLSGRLLRYDALAQSWRESRLARDPVCPECAASRACGD